MSDEPTILVMGHQIEAHELPKMALRTATLAETNGFEVKAGFSRFRTPTKEYGPNAQKAGETTGGVEIDNHWIDAVNRERKVRFTAWWHDGSFNGSVWQGHMLKSTVLNKFIRGENDGE